MAFLTAVGGGATEQVINIKNDGFNQILTMSRFVLGRLVIIFKDKNMPKKCNFRGARPLFVFIIVDGS